MTSDQQSLYGAAERRYRSYLAEREAFVAAMAALGIPTRNVDPLACYAEVIVARELGGTIIPHAAHPDADVRLPGGERVQVKSLRATSGRPNDNGRGWFEYTRKKARADAPLLDADWSAIAVCWCSPIKSRWQRRQGARIRGRIGPVGAIIGGFRCEKMIDLRPYAMLIVPVEDRDRFPVLNVKVIAIRHIEKRLSGAYDLSQSPIRMVDLRGRVLDDGPVP